MAILRPEIYVESHDRGFGMWLSLDRYDTAEAFYAKASAMTYCPEGLLSFSDFEGFPAEFFLDEKLLDERLWDWLKLDKRERDVVWAWLDIAGGTDSIDWILDHHIGSADSWSDYVEDYVDDIGMLSSGDKDLRPYFDYEAYGRDLRHDFTVAESSNGVEVFSG